MEGSLPTGGAFGELAARLHGIANDDDAGVNLASALLSEAARLGASDVHLWPERLEYAVAIRRDGRLHRVCGLPHQAGRLLVGRVRVLCRLPAGDEGLPQDGSFALAGLASADARDQPVRAAFYPVLRGVRLVLRFPEARLELRLADLGFPAALAEALRVIVRRREGLFLVTGPAGSGKTTTLYTLLRLLAESPDAPNVMTLEDPVERELPEAMQTPLHPERGFDYAEAIRSVLRQDPDVLMLGEIRDPESARMAARLALTGHLVMSTLHAGRALAISARLEEFGVPGHLWRPTLLAALAQRLLRRLCQACATACDAPAETPDWLAGPRAFRASAGCEACHQTGFSGRAPVAELWVPTSSRVEVPAVATMDSGERLWPARGLDEAAWALAAEGKIAIREWLLSSI